MEPLTLALLGSAGYYLWEKKKNPAWSPLAWLTRSPLDKHAALDAIKVSSVPTPGSAAALDPGMTTDQVKQVNDALTMQTDAAKISAMATALRALGLESSANALAAKAVAIDEAKALGATDAEIHAEQLQASAGHLPAPRVGWGTPFLVGVRSGFGRQFQPRRNDRAVSTRRQAVQSGRRRFVGPQYGHPQYGHPQHGHPWQGHEHHRRHFVEPEPEPAPDFEPELHHHHHHHHPEPEVPIHGYVTSGEEELFYAGAIPYSGNGLVAEFPNGPVQGQVPWADPYYPGAYGGYGGFEGYGGYGGGREGYGGWPQHHYHGWNPYQHHGWNPYQHHGRWH